MPSVDRTLEERVPRRKNPIGFVSARRPPEPSPHPLEPVMDFFAVVSLLRCAAAAGQRRGRTAWAEITKAQQPPAQE